jgi:FixJ family two-component response regulator
VRAFETPNAPGPLCSGRPAAEIPFDNPSQPNAPHESVPNQMATPSEQQTVLLVDDDGDLRNSLKVHLEMAGFSVLEAGRADEAERVAEAHEEPIHALMMDIHLPDGWGSVVAHRLRALHPEMATVFITGYAAVDPVLKSGMGHVEWHLQKPFGSTEMIDVVNRAIAGHRASRD